MYPDNSNNCLPFCICRKCHPELYGPSVNVTKTSFEVMIRTMYCLPDIQARMIVDRFWNLLDRASGMIAIMMFAENVQRGTTLFDNEKCAFYTMEKHYL